MPRLAGVDIPNDKQIWIALTYIHGVGKHYSRLILKEAGIEPGAAGALESIDSLEPPKLTFKVPLAPEVDLGDYHAIRLPYEWSAPDEKAIDAAVEKVLNEGCRTADIYQGAANEKKVNTAAMGDAIVAAL